MRVGLVTVGFDRFPRHGAGKRERKQMREIEVGVLQTDAQRVSVGRVQSRHCRIVVEAIGFFRTIGKLVEAHDLAFEEECVGGAIPRIEKAFDRVRVVGGRELAPLAFECRIVREVDAGLYFQRVGFPLVGNHRQGFRDVRHQLCGTREVVVSQQRIEQRLDDGARVIVRDLYGIEAALGRLKRDAQCFAGDGGVRDQRRQKTEQRAEQQQCHDAEPAWILLDQWVSAAACERECG